MTMLSRNRLTAGATLCAAIGCLAAFAAVALADGASDLGKIDRKMKIVVADPDLSSDRLDLADYDSMAVGERRHLETAGGKPIDIEKTQSGLRIEINGKTIEVGTTAFDSDLPAKVKIADAGGHGNVVWVGGDEPRKVMVLRQVAKDGSTDESAFAYRIGDGKLPMLAPIDDVARRLEKSAKFQELDAAARAKVLEALRELEAEPLDAVDPGHALVIQLGGEEDSDQQ
ncbi:MAG: hypothetical protein U0X73_11575 [Thermoanaerobaculia bacterium]